jgi:hypothetical protein
VHGKTQYTHRLVREMLVTFFLHIW